MKPNIPPFRVNKNFKLAIGITKHDFVITVNGRDIIEYRYSDGSFLGNQLNFGCVAVDGLSVEIQYVDTYMLSAHDEVDQVAETEIEAPRAKPLKLRNTLMLTNKNLARILHY